MFIQKLWACRPPYIFKLLNPRLGEYGPSKPGCKECTVLDADTGHIVIICSTSGTLVDPMVGKGRV